MMPGPTLMTDYADVTYTLIWAVMLSNLAMFIFGLLFTRASIVVTRVRNKVLGPIIVVLCVIGAFAINNSVFDVGLMFAFGILGRRIARTTRTPAWSPTSSGAAPAIT